MKLEKERSKEVAEHVRKAYKELRWAAAHAAAIYELIRQEDTPPLVDPNQLKLFDDECTRI